MTREISTSRVPAPPLARSDGRTQPRIDGLDVARAVAVLGMFAQHFMHFPVLRLSLEDPASWFMLVNNNSTVLFAVLAGTSKALIDGGRWPQSGVRQLQARMNIVARALLLFGISGFLVTFISTPGSVLGYIAAGFIVSLPFLRVAPRTLFITAAVLLLVLPYPIHVAQSFTAAFAPNGTVGESSVDLLLTGLCPAIVFLPLYLIGIGLGRLDLFQRRIQVIMIVTGAAVTAAGYGLAAWFVGQFGLVPATAFGSKGNFGWPWWQFEFMIRIPHLNTVLQMVIGAGIALFVIGVALLLCSDRRLARLLFPLRAVGMCAFTAYLLQFVAVLIFVDQDTGEGPAHFFVSLTAVTVAVSVIAIVAKGRGPFEWVMMRWAGWMSRVPVMTGSSPVLTTAQLEKR